MLPPLRGQRRLQRVSYFGAIARLQHLLPTLQEWCCHHPCKARFRLAGSPLPGGRRTLWITTKGFRSLILLFWIYPGAREVSWCAPQSTTVEMCLRSVRDASLDHLVGGGKQGFGMVRPSAFAVLRLITKTSGCRS